MGGTIAGLPSVFIEPPFEDVLYAGSQVAVKESFGITVVRAGSLGEAKLVAEGLNR